MADSDDLLFREVQHFRQTWLWMIVLLIPVAYIIAVIDLMILNESSDTESFSAMLVILIGMVFAAGIPGLMYSANLITEVRQGGIYIRFSPFHRTFRKVSQDVSEYEIREYNAIREYGGWGLRGGNKNGAYNVSGNTGLQLKFSNGNKLLIGTRKPDELIMAIRLAFK